MIPENTETSETDAHVAKVRKARGFLFPDEIDFMRKLERERNEARILARDWREQWSNDTKRTDPPETKYPFPWENAERINPDETKDDEGADDAVCSALSILQGCGLHGGYYNTINKAAEGARDLIRSLRADLYDPPHDIQCAVLCKLGVEGFTKEGVAPTLRLIPLPNAEPIHGEKDA